MWVCHFWNSLRQQSPASENKHVLGLSITTPPPPLSLSPLKPNWFYALQFPTFVYCRWTEGGKLMLSCQESLNSSFWASSASSLLLSSDGIKTWVNRKRKARHLLIYPHIQGPSLFSRPPEQEKHRVPSLSLQGGEDRNTMTDKPWKTQNRSFSSSVRLVHAEKRGRCCEVGRGAITFELSRCILESHSLTKLSGIGKT